VNTLEMLQKKEKFSTSEALLADFILENKEKVLSMSVQDLAKSSYTSTSSVVRMCKKMGLDGYQSFKIQLATDLQKSDDDFAIKIDPNFPFSKNDCYFEYSKKIYNLCKEALTDTYKKCSAHDFEKSVQLLEKSEKCCIVAIGDSYLRCLDFQNKMMKINETILMSTIPGEIGHLANTMTPKDCAIVVSYSGNTNETAGYAEILKRKHCPFILITSRPNSRIAKMASVVLCVTDRESQSIKFSTFASQIGIEFVLNNLYAYFFIRNYDKNTTQRLETEMDFINTRSD